MLIKMDEAGEKYSKDCKKISTNFYLEPGWMEIFWP
jgi:hypothetical protein